MDPTDLFCRVSQSCSDPGMWPWCCGVLITTFASAVHGCGLQLTGSGEEQLVSPFCALMGKVLGTFLSEVEDFSSVLRWLCIDDGWKI